MTREEVVARIDALINAVREDATACEDGGFGDYADERQSLIDAIDALVRSAAGDGE